MSVSAAFQGRGIMWDRYCQLDQPYGSSEYGYDRWLEELEEAVFGQSGDPRRQQPIPNTPVQPDPARDRDRARDRPSRDDPRRQEPDRDREVAPDRNREARPQ